MIDLGVISTSPAFGWLVLAIAILVTFDDQLSRRFKPRPRQDARRLRSVRLACRAAGVTGRYRRKPRTLGTRLGWTIAIASNVVVALWLISGGAQGAPTRPAPAVPIAPIEVPYATKGSIG